VKFRVKIRLALASVVVSQFLLLAPSRAVYSALSAGSGTLWLTREVGNF
jgi:hypothetical protein